MTSGDDTRAKSVEVNPNVTAHAVAGAPVVLKNSEPSLPVTVTRTRPLNTSAKPFALNGPAAFRASQICCAVNVPAARIVDTVVGPNRTLKASLTPVVIT